MLESFLGHLLAGGVFCLFAGQPLTVLGCTGPVLIFEKILMDFCLSYGMTYLTIRLWIGLWSALFCIIIVAVDGSAIVRSESMKTHSGCIYLVSEKTRSSHSLSLVGTLLGGPDSLPKCLNIHERFEYLFSML